MSFSKTNSATVCLKERSQLRRRERSCMGSCGSGNPERFSMPAAVQSSQDLARSTRYELAERKLRSLVCEALYQQEKQMDLSSDCTFTSASAPLAAAKARGCRGQHQKLSLVLWESPPLLYPAALLCAEGLKKDEAGLMQFSLSCLQGTLMVGQ